MWRIRDRQTFLELRRRGRRARRGPVTVTLLADDATPVTPPRFAFAIPRKVGNAVRRNAIRRGVRGRLVQRMATDEPRIPPGAYLVAVRAGGAPSSPAQIADHVDGCLDDLWARR